MTGGGTRLPLLEDRAAQAPPPFQRIAIIGLGAVGGALALALRRAWPGALVIGVDTSATIEMAIRMHAIDVGSDDVLMAADADLLVLAGGADENARVLPYLAEAVPGEAVVLVLGEGAAAADGARTVPARFAIVAGLPAVELQGRCLQAARADLFAGRLWVITPVTAFGDAVERVRDLIRAVGARPVAGPIQAPGVPSGDRPPG